MGECGASAVLRGLEPTPFWNIDAGRSNAIKVLGRALREAHATAPFRLVSLDGGKSRNAIPRDAVALCSIAAGAESAFGEVPLVTALAWLAIVWLFFGGHTPAPPVPTTTTP